MKSRKCRCCGQPFTPLKNISNQMYCGESACRRHRRAIWQRRKIREDPAYKENQKDAQTDWVKGNPGYMQAYRKTHPYYREHERQRCLKRRKEAKKVLATADLPNVVKMDSWNLQPPLKSGIYKISAATGVAAVKMDSCIVQLTVIQRVAVADNAP